MRKIEAVAAFGMWAMVIIAVDRVGATQVDWENQVWSEAEWMEENELREEDGKEEEIGTDPWKETESESFTETERESETESCRILVSDIRVTETERYYDGTDHVKVEAKVTGLPDGMSLLIEGKTQQADVGIWPVEVVCTLEGEESERYEIIQEPGQEPLTVKIFPRPLTLTISNARKSYYAEATLENLIFEEEKILKVTGFLEQDCQGKEVPDGFCYPELEIDTTVLQKDSPMFDKGKLIHYRHAVTVKRNADGTVSGNPTSNYTFNIEESDNCEGGDVILSSAPITGTLDYTIQCSDPAAMWMDQTGILWVRKGEQIQILPGKNSGFTDGKIIPGIRADGEAEFTLTRRNEMGEIIAESQIRSISWKTDGEAPQSEWNINGIKGSEKNPVYLNTDVQLAVSGIREYGSGIKNVELYVAGEEEMQLDGEVLYQNKRSAWKRGEQMFIHREGHCRVWIRLEDMVGNVQYQCTGEIITDRSAPEVNFEEITAGSANNGKVMPVCRVRDTHLKKESLKLILSGYQNGEQQVRWKKIDSENKEELAFQMENLPAEQKWDDVYTLRVEADDLAGNHSSREIRFSVNRFGSVYYLGEETQKQTEQFYVSASGSLTIYEVNVDYLTESGILLGHEGETRQLKRGVDYTVTKNGNDETWKEYCYNISADCFKEEGRYYLICASEDRAWNSGDNRMRKQKIEFAVDKSAPSVLVTGVEENGIYREAKKKVNLECRDNLAIQEVQVWLNGKEIRKNAKEEQEIYLEQENGWQTLRVVATDRAGNQKDTGEINFWLGEQGAVPKQTPKKKTDGDTKLKSGNAGENIETGTENAEKKMLTEQEKYMAERAEKETGNPWIMIAVIAVFTALTAIFFLRKQEK